MKIIKYPEPETYDVLCQRPALETASLEIFVKNVLADVKKEGDEAVCRYALQFDKVRMREFKVGEEAFREAEALLSKPLKEAIILAARNIEKFHSAQIDAPEKIETQPGITCWRKSLAISKVGLYIPGGSAPLFSTILMLGIPAKIAGCEEIILCSPPAPDGSLHPAILFAAKLVGINTVFKIGGIQAIAAMAYGTPTVPKVYKIFGPGNQYVTCAKQMVSRDGTAIDMPAGPSELAVLADEFCVPAFVAADLLSQAEHGTDSQVILVSDKEQVLEDVMAAIAEQLESLPRKAIASGALLHSKAILVKDKTEGMHFLNQYAPEHLILACADAALLADLVQNAGSVFLGNYACESAGDYASGTNHTLPTNGYARAYSGVSVDSFVKKVTFQSISSEGIGSIGAAVELMAEAEGLEGHKKAVSLRLEAIKKKVKQIKI
jgi:histidinol dehydrogenase